MVLPVPSALLTTRQTDLAPAALLAQQSHVFAVFDATTQDSGNVSYGVGAGGQRFFVKTAGDPDGPAAFLSHHERVELLRNAVRIAKSVTHRALPPLRNVVESPHGPLLVYDWADGELIGATAARRKDPESAFARFKRLSLAERIAAIGVVLDLHVALAAHRWVASDFYDGSLIYDFAAQTMHVVDVDHYHEGPFTNHMGRMFGSTRFMAPEEMQIGATIDERTTVFAMGRMIQQFVPEGDGASHDLLDVAARACRPDPALRFPSLADCYRAWSVVALSAQAD